MALKRVYLDQRDWITLARQHYGRTRDNRVADVLAIVREASTTGQASFPLSASHYIETYHRRDPGQRQRLGAFMAEISRFHTIASAPDLLKAEVHVALSSMLGVEPAYRPTPFGRGLRHAFGPDAPLSYFEDNEREKRATAQFGSEWLFEYFESMALTGPPEKLPANGIALPSREFAQRQLDFELDTARRLHAWGHSADRAHRLVLAQEAQDLVHPINDAVAAMGVDIWAQLKSREALTDFILSLPAKGAICRLRMSAHENQNFRWHIGDLNDITALGTAAGYCDIVVGENHWGNILGRHAPNLHARVTSSLHELPRLLLT